MTVSIPALLRAGAGPLDVFEPAMVAHLPEPARRWLTHAISPGTPLYQRAELGMRGEIRLGTRWHRYVATEVITPDTGFIWAARARYLGCPCPATIPTPRARVRCGGGCSACRYCPPRVPTSR